MRPLKVPMSKKENEFERFDTTMRKLITVPHSEIKAKLDAERVAKKKKTKKAVNDKRNQNTD